MSNPAQVTIADVGIHVYTHLGGYEIEKHVAKALDVAEDRRDQPEYLARAVIDSVEQLATGDITGIGVSNRRYTSVYRSVTVDCYEDTVSVETIYDEPDQEYSINEFVEKYGGTHDE